MIAKTLKCLRITEFRDGRWVIPCVNSTNRDGLSFFLTTVRRAVVCDVVGTTVVIMSVKWFSVFAAATTTTLPRRRWESGGGDACARSAAPPRCIPVYTATVMRVRLPFARRPSPAAAAFRQKLCHWAPVATLKISGSPTVVGVEVCFVASVHRVRCAFFVADSRRPRPIIPVFRPFFFFFTSTFFFYVSPVASRSRRGDYYLCSLSVRPRYRSDSLEPSGWIGEPRVRVLSLCSKKKNPWCLCRPSSRAGPAITITGDEVKVAGFFFESVPRICRARSSSVSVKRLTPNILSKADFWGNSTPVERFWK